MKCKCCGHDPNDPENGDAELRQRYVEWCIKTMGTTCNLLPLILRMGWNGSPHGFMPYMPDWRKTRDLPLALIDLFCMNNTAAERNRIRQDIINTFYGGDEGFMRFVTKAVDFPPATHK